MWPFDRKQKRELELSISDPVLAEYFGVGNRSFAGVSVNESSALGLSAVYRAVSLISGTIASLPLRTLRTVEGRRERAPSFLDSPDGVDGFTSFEWKELALIHLLLHGNVFGLHVFNGAGAIAGLTLVHPLAVSVEWADVPGGRLFRVTLEDGTVREYDATEMTHIPGPSLDGLRGLSPIAVARNSLGTGIAGDKSAARMFANGLMITGLVTPADGEDIGKEEAKQILTDVRASAAGHDNAGDVAFVNRRLNFSPWMLSAEDAQFIESRQFQIEEVGRLYGVPPHLLMQTEKSTSWGTGIEEQNRGLARHTLLPWTNRIEERLSRLLPSPKFAEFDYSEYLRPSPEDEINLLIQQVNSGLITVNEARHIRNMPPVEGGDVLRGQSPSPSEPPESEAA